MFRWIHFGSCWKTIRHWEGAAVPPSELQDQEWSGTCLNSEHSEQRLRCCWSRGGPEPGRGLKGWGRQEIQFCVWPKWKKSKSEKNKIKAWYILDFKLSLFIYNILCHHTADFHFIKVSKLCSHYCDLFLCSLFYHYNNKTITFLPQWALIYYFDFIKYFLILKFNLQESYCGIGQNKLATISCLITYAD